MKLITKNFQKGFTLIELLVVIAIIGILASVVLASLNSARSSGEDAAIKSNINNARAAAELAYDEGGNTYDGICTDGTGALDQFIDGATTAGSADVNCGDDAEGYALEAQLSNGTDYYCVDSSGAAVEGASSMVADASDTSCS